MIDHILYDGNIYHYMGISCGEYVFRQSDGEHSVRFTPGMFDLMRAMGLIKEV